MTLKSFFLRFCPKCLQKSDFSYLLVTSFLGIGQIRAFHISMNLCYKVVFLFYLQKNEEKFLVLFIYPISNPKLHEPKSH